MSAEWPAGQRVSLILHKFSRGGSDRVAAHLARGFTNLGMAVELIVFCEGGEVEDVLTAIIGDDIPIRYLGATGGLRPLDLLRGLPKLIRALRASHPDIVISTANNTALASAIAFRKARLQRSRLFLKTTNPIASSRHTGLAKRLRDWSYDRIFKWAAAVWTLSPEESEEMEAAFPAYRGLFQDVTNPYVTEVMLAPSARADRSGGAPKALITIARLTRQKRLERLIAAFARSRHADATLLILGEGELRGSLANLARDLGVQDRVSMPGYVADVTPALRAADLFVLTSDYEGLPAAALEAMAANCPVLSTDCFPCAGNLLSAAPGCGIIDNVAPDALAVQIDRYLDRQRPSGLDAIARRFSIANGVASHVERMRP